MGVRCLEDKDCWTGLECLGGFCSDPLQEKKNVWDGFNCTTKPDAKCGICPGAVCNIPAPKDKEEYRAYPCLFNCLPIEGSTDTKVGRCSACNCDDEEILNHRCIGRNCGHQKIKGVWEKVECSPGLTCIS